jgi:tetratricopeptide (TPR) repeat protein
VLGEYGSDRVGPEEADREFLTAIHLEPDQSQVRCWYSHFLAGTSRYEEALRELSIAQRLDPLAPWLAAGAPGVYYFVRDYERSIEVGLQTIAADPENENAYGWVCASYLRLGRFDESAEVCEVAQEYYPDWGYDAYEHAFRGEEEAALQDLARRANTFPGSGDIYWSGAEVHAALGDIDEAFRWLRRGIEEDRSQVFQVPGDPAWDVLRSDPRFSEILREIGFEH